MREAAHGMTDMAAGALEGLRVLDFGTGWAGPMAGGLLGDMGAEVIKIESRTYMDGLRRGRPIVTDDVHGGDSGKWPELQPTFQALNKNKRSITVNLQQPEAVELMKELVRRSDVVVENFSAGVMERLGLGYAVLERINPRIIAASMSAAGQSGPLKGVTGYAPTFAALSGMSLAAGYEDGRLAMAQTAYSDTVAAVTTVFAVLCALYEREQSGRGQYIEVAQWEAMTCLVPELILTASMRGEDLGPRGSSHPFYCPHGSFRCADADSWVSVAVRSDAEWASLHRLIAPVDGVDERADVVERRAHRDAIHRALEAWTASRLPAEVTKELQALGIAAFPVLNIEGLFFDEHLQAREAYPFVEHALVGAEPVPGVPWKLEKTPGSVRSAAPLLGADNEYVLKGILGLDDERYRALAESGAIEVA